MSLILDDVQASGGVCDGEATGRGASHPAEQSHRSAHSGRPAVEHRRVATVSPGPVTACRHGDAFVGRDVLRWNLNCVPQK